MRSSSVDTDTSFLATLAFLHAVILSPSHVPSLSLERSRSCPPVTPACRIIQKQERYTLPMTYALSMSPAQGTPVPANATQPRPRPTDSVAVAWVSGLRPFQVRPVP